jgi:hypothetical protein
MTLRTKGGLKDALGSGCKFGEDMIEVLHGIFSGSPQPLDVSAVGRSGSALRAAVSRSALDAASTVLG